MTCGSGIVQHFQLVQYIHAVISSINNTGLDNMSQSEPKEISENYFS